MDKKTIIKGCENWVNNHKGENFLLTYSSIVELLALLKEQEEQIKNRDESLEKAREEIKWLRGMLKEQEAMNVDALVQWCIDSHIMGDATVRGIKHWIEKYKEYKEIKVGG